MELSVLEKYIPSDATLILRKWLSGHSVHIRITRDRHSKLGDYRKNRDGSHQITVNGTLPEELFFFVLTHELAHLMAFHHYGFRIAPHGAEWKHVFRTMLMESLEVYTETLQEILQRFSKSPKANFLASPELVKYFYADAQEEAFIFVENIPQGHCFEYRSKQYIIEGKRKKNYLCKEIESGKQYVFSPLVQVRQIKI